MKKGESKIPAYLVLRVISLFLVTIGTGLLLLAGVSLVSVAPIIGQQGFAMPITGLLLLFVGFVGPARIIIKGVHVPAEVRQTILVHAIVLPIIGLVLILAAIVNAPTFVAWSYIIVGLLIMVSALVGFYALSRKLPPTFYISEMLSVIKSVGLTGDKKNSPADREFTRWTEGKPDGVLLGTTAPDGKVTTMTGETVSLNTFFADSGSSLLVLNFGSYTCPHFRKRINELHSLMDKWLDRGVRFLTVYTAEAHPEDGWKLAHQYDNDAEYTNENDFNFYYARSIDDRSKMAKWLIEKKHFKLPVVLDSMENDLLKAYNTWPIRLYIIDAGKVVFCGQQGPFGYEPGRVDKALKSMLG